MKVTSLVDNESVVSMPVEHGLSLFVELHDGRTVLFDMGQGRLFADNALRLGLSIGDVDMAVVSHGHYDHGGGLRTFLGLNAKAPVYVHEDAFDPHYSLRDTGLAYIGLERSLRSDTRLVCCGDITKVSSDIILFAGVHGDCITPPGNRLLFGPRSEVRDTFTHEQNMLIIGGGDVVLFAGCAHAGIVNIINKVWELTGLTPTHVFSGMHLVKSGLDAGAESRFVADLSRSLSAVPHCRYHTMHCTGLGSFARLRQVLPHSIDYLSCGESVVI